MPGRFEKPRDDTRVKSLAKGIELLDFLARFEDGATFSDVCDGLGWNKTSTHRFLQTFVDERVLRFDAKTKHYYLGYRLQQWGSAAANQLGLRRLIRPLLRDLTERTGETSNLALRDEYSAIFTDNVESTRGLRVFSRIGQRATPHATAVGKIILAHARKEQQNRYFAEEERLQKTPHTITVKALLLEELSRIREQGWAIDDEESEVGARCMGCPIRDYSGEVIGAISISAPTSRVTRESVPTLVPVLKEVAENASSLLGYREESMSALGN